MHDVKFFVKFLADVWFGRCPFEPRRSPLRAALHPVPQTNDKQPPPPQHFPRSEFTCGLALHPSLYINLPDHFQHHALPVVTNTRLFYPTLARGRLFDLDGPERLAYHRIIMPDYVHASTQTRWAGLMQKDTVRPDALLLSPPHDTPTPPDEMLTQKPQFMYGGAVPTIKPPSPQEHQFPSTPPAATLLERRRNLLGLDARIEMPRASHELNDEIPFSPPTTHALLSPLPEANRRHAGHTPLIPRSLSPEPEKLAEAHDTVDDDSMAPELDEDKGLTGALTLPSNPMDGTQDADHIGLKALNEVLGKISKQQRTLRGEFDEDEPGKDAKEFPRIDSVDAALEDLSLSRKGSADSRRSNMEEVDGVLLKQPPTNFGAPFGQL